MPSTIRKLSYLGLSLEKRDDGRFYVTRNGEDLNVASSETIGLVYLEMAEEEILAANPSIKKPEDRVAAERGYFDINRARAESSAKGRAKALGKGGRGGRGGV